MTSLTLKSCQQAALDTRAAQLKGAALAVWLAPSETIRSQMLKALQTTGHAYRAALESHDGAGLKVCALEDVAQIAPPDGGRQAVVVVTTIQSFRIEDAGQRNVYSFPEAFEPHLRGLDAQRLAAPQPLPDAVVTAEDNVLYHVSAQELAAENMVKLPMALAQHPQGWPQADFAAVQTQRGLEAEALRRHLSDELHIPPKQIVVATGDVRGLDGLDLSRRDCLVRFVITVQALREGWDCPFAYILCSPQKLSSAEHALDVASMIAPAVNWPLFEENLPHPSVEWSEIATTFIAISPTPALQAATGVSVVNVGAAAQVVVTGPIGADLEDLLLAQVRGVKKQELVREKVAEHNALVAAQRSPAARGAPFAPAPTLGYRTQAQAPLWPLERDAVLEFKGSHLLNDPYEIEKRLVGERWGQTSHGRAIFAWLTQTRDGLRARSVISCAFERRSRDAMRGAKRAVWQGHTSDLQRSSAPESGGTNVQVIAERALSTAAQLDRALASP